jgi:hypothetical protein
VVTGLPPLHRLSWIGALRGFGWIGTVDWKYWFGRFFLFRWVVSFGRLFIVRRVDLVCDVLAIPEVGPFGSELADHPGM